MSRNHSKSGGFTIIETMIFLAVSSALLVAVITTMSGQQGKTEFSQLVRGFESSLQDIANDVSTGYSSYPFSSGTGCWYSGTNLQLSLPSDPLPPGATRCIFAGKAIQFAPSGSASNYIIYPVVGMQQWLGQEVTNLKDANLKTLSNNEQVQQLGSLATFSQVTYNDGSVTNPIGVFGFYTTFQGYTGGLLNSGATNTDVIAVPSSILEPINQGATEASKAGQPGAIINPPRGITICIKSGSSDQHALVTIGGTGGRLAVNSTIYRGTSCS